MMKKKFFFWTQENEKGENAIEIVIVIVIAIAISTKTWIFFSSRRRIN